MKINYRSFFWGVLIVVLISSAICSSAAEDDSLAIITETPSKLQDLDIYFHKIDLLKSRIMKDSILIKKLISENLLTEVVIRNDSQSSNWPMFWITVAIFIITLVFYFVQYRNFQKQYKLQYSKNQKDEIRFFQELEINNTHFTKESSDRIALMREQLHSQERLERIRQDRLLEDSL